jgi:hypothetical protein
MYQTKAICLEAVKKNYKALSHINPVYKTDEILLVGIQQSHDVYANYVVNIESLTFNLAAVQQNGLALQYINNKTPELCLAAVQQNGLALQYSNNNITP